MRAAAAVRASAQLAAQPFLAGRQGALVASAAVGGDGGSRCKGAGFSGEASAEGGLLRRPCRRCMGAGTDGDASAEVGSGLSAVRGRPDASPRHTRRFRTQPSTVRGGLGVGPVGWVLLRRSGGAAVAAALPFRRFRGTTERLGRPDSATAATGAASDAAVRAPPFACAGRVWRKGRGAAAIGDLGTGRVGPRPVLAT